MPEHSLILVRHAPTAGNAAGRYIGHTDEPLSAAGVALAHALGEQLRALLESVERAQLDVFASDLLRARETAAIALPEHPAVADARLRELDFGVFTGFTYEENMQRHGDAYARWLSDPVSAQPPGGESVQALEARLRSWLDERSADTLTIVFTHAGPIRVMHSILRGVPLEAALRLSFDNCAVVQC